MFAILALSPLVYLVALPLWGAIVAPLVDAAAREGTENVGLWLLGLFYGTSLAIIAAGLLYFVVVYRSKSPRRPGPGAASGQARPVLATVVAAILPWLALYLLFGVL